RNLIRHKIIPEFERLYPGACQRIANLALESQEMVQHYRVKLENELSAFENQKIPADFLNNLPPAIAFEALGIILTNFDGQIRQYSRRLFHQILRKLKDTTNLNSTWSINISGG